MCDISVNELFTSDLGVPRTLDDLEEIREKAEREADTRVSGCISRSKAVYSSISMRPVDVPVSFTLRHLTSPYAV
jgi:hypothetical protein